MRPPPLRTLNSRGVLFVQRRNACLKLAASLKPKAKAMSSLVMLVSRKYFTATCVRSSFTSSRKDTFSLRNCR